MKKIILVVLFVICGLSAIQAQTAVKDSTFQKHYLITADVAGGVNAIIIIYPFGTVIAGVGMQYNYNEHAGVATGIKYESIIGLGDGDEVLHCLYIPVEMEYHIRHFYFRGGLNVGMQLFHEAKPCLYLAATVGLGGRIPLTLQDGLNLGVHFAAGSDFDKVGPMMPRLSAVLKIGYEHRF